MSQKMTLSQHEVKPMWIKKQGGLGVESHENPDDGAVDPRNFGVFKHLTKLSAWEDLTEF